METAFPDAGAAPVPVAPDAGMLQAALIAGAGWATRPGPVPGASVVAVVVVLAFLELWLLLV